MLKLKHFFFLIPRIVVHATREHMRFRVWLLAFVLLILAFFGNVITRDGLLVVSVILGFIVLVYLDKWMEEHEAK